MNLTDSLKEIAGTVMNNSLNRYFLTIKEFNTPIDVEEFQGQESLSKLYQYSIYFTSTEHDIRAEQLLRKNATFLFSQPLQTSFAQLKTKDTVKTVHGVITSFKRIKSSKDQTLYAITLEPFLALLDKQFRSHRFFVNKSVPEVVEQVLTEHGLEGWEYDFQLTNEYPQREQINQYQETDLQFIERLLSEIGVFYFFTLQEDTQTEIIHFADQQSAWVFDKKLVLNSPSGMNDSAPNAVWALQIQQNVVQASVATKDYNFREAHKKLDSIQADASKGAGDTTNYGTAYHYQPRHLTTGDKIEPEVETANFWAKLDHERFLSTQTTVTGKSTEASLSAGQVISINDKGIPSVLPELLQSPIVIIEVIFTGSRKDALELNFTAVPYTESWCWRPTLKSRPKVLGTMTARITSAQDNDIYAWQDAAGLYHVQFDADQDTKAAGQESMPVRLAKPYAGDTYGIHFPLIQGTEVAIAFHEGDPDRPYIAHALHDSRHPDHVTEQNHTRNVIRTPANNKLRMEDKRGAEHIKLSTEYGGKSQLNLGHLVNEEGEERGQGAELRTDNWVAVRGGKGILLSAYEQPEADGVQLSMDSINKQLQYSCKVSRSFSNILRTAKIDPLEELNQEDNFEKNIHNIQSPSIVLGAPAGIALATNNNINTCASNNNFSYSGGNTEISALNKIYLAAKRKLTLFAHELGIKLISAAGKIEIQAQSDSIDVSAKKKVTIESIDDQIEIQSKKKITISCGSSYIIINNNSITFQATHDLIFKGNRFLFENSSPTVAKEKTYDVCSNAVNEASSHGAAIFVLGEKS